MQLCAQRVSHRACARYLTERIMFYLRFCVLSLLIGQASGCAVVAVADAAVTVVATGVKVTAKAVGAVADAVIPD